MLSFSWRRMHLFSEESLLLTSGNVIPMCMTRQEGIHANIDRVVMPKSTPFLLLSKCGNVIFAAVPKCGSNLITSRS